MKKQEIMDRLIKSCPLKKITCSDARRLAEEMGVEPGEIGKLCDEAGIKICACELGCF